MSLHILRNTIDYNIPNIQIGHDTHYYCLLFAVFK